MDQSNLDTECAPLLCNEIKIDIEETVVTPSIHDDTHFGKVKTENIGKIQNPGEFT